MKRSENWLIVEVDLNKLKYPVKNRWPPQWAKFKELLDHLYKEEWCQAKTYFSLDQDLDNPNRINDKNFFD